MIKLALTSDLHWGITQPKAIHKLSALIAKEKPNIIINAGDNNGGVNGAHATRMVFKSLREHNPDCLILSVLGNHDYWSMPRKARKGHSVTYQEYCDNFDKLIMAHAEFDVIDLSALAAYMIIVDEESDLTLEIFGQSMWYEQFIPTNDYNFLPQHTPFGEHIYYTIFKSEYNGLMNKVESLSPKGDNVKRVFVSHMPVLDVGQVLEQARGGWWGATRTIGPLLRDQFGVDLFLNGHTHGNLNGPVRYECGGDYGKPKFKIIEVR